MDLSLQTQIETYLSHLDGLMRRGRQLRDALAADRSNPSCSNPARSNSESIAATRAWQEDCGVTINQLSGGSKAHWLARSFSAAFLIRSASGHAVEGAEPTEIVTRLLDVLEQAVATLSGMDSGIGPSVSGYSPAPAEAPPPHRFDFVHNPELRPVVEQAYIDSRRALEQEDYDRALRTSCGILEAIVTDALEHARLAARAVSGAPPELPEGKIEEGRTEEVKTEEGKTEAVKTEAGKIAEAKIADWSFETRLAVAEKAGLIRSGCARLPAAARTYRDHTDAGGAKTMVSERDARVAGQVLHVVMRDLDPGR